MIARPQPLGVLTDFDLAAAIAPLVKPVQDAHIRIGDHGPDGPTLTDVWFWRVAPCVVEVEIPESELTFVLDECRTLLGETVYDDAVVPWRAVLEPAWAINGASAFVRYRVEDRR